MLALKRRSFWRKMVFAMVATVVVALGGGVMAPQSAQAEISAATDADQALARKRIEDFQKWRADIPDYEMRLFDRVKEINKRTVDLQRVLVIAGIALVILIPLSMLALLRYVGTRNGGDESARRWTAFSESATGASNHRMMRKLLARQQAISDAFTELSALVEDSQRGNARLEGVLGRLKGDLDAVAADIDTIRPAS